uniref:Uncharacterized protein n=1 Tax=Chromera velia CCMP2878 TaxID=1169474 RepID=A0A0G4GZS0_9ALVE|eukprot:Cvel_5459.t1-p1 / transcript=Cvel_5459.t1 / gene=Cvel_5459 / organism=Chromera_velia_CCMP2878 / gene_product=hypothetical protein / transcript_product=hypothetical protein / location=Cvel_scaffold255:40346-43525(-) / protein_length=737 / sequence_SO=supercontig / SO=protein_coding / is_pseudo=false
MNSKAVSVFAALWGLLCVGCGVYMVIFSEKLEDVERKQQVAAEVTLMTESLQDWEFIHIHNMKEGVASFKTKKYTGDDLVEYEDEKKFEVDDSLLWLDDSRIGTWVGAAHYIFANINTTIGGADSFSVQIQAQKGSSTTSTIKSQTVPFATDYAFPLTHADQKCYTSKPSSLRVPQLIGCYYEEAETDTQKACESSFGEGYYEYAIVKVEQVLVEGASKMVYQVQCVMEALLNELCVPVQVNEEGTMFKLSDAKGCQHPFDGSNSSYASYIPTSQASTQGAYVKVVSDSDPTILLNTIAYGGHVLPPNLKPDGLPVETAKKLRDPSSHFSSDPTTTGEVVYIDDPSYSSTEIRHAHQKSLEPFQVTMKYDRDFLILTTEAFGILIAILGGLILVSCLALLLLPGELEKCWRSSLKAGIVRLRTREYLRRAWEDRASELQMLQNEANPPNVYRDFAATRDKDPFRNLNPEFLHSRSRADRFNDSEMDMDTQSNRYYRSADGRDREMEGDLTAGDVLQDMQTVRSGGARRKKSSRSRRIEEEEEELGEAMGEGEGMMLAEEGEEDDETEGGMLFGGGERSEVGAGWDAGTLHTGVGASTIISQMMKEPGGPGGYAGGEGDEAESSSRKSKKKKKKRSKETDGQSERGETASEWEREGEGEDRPINHGQEGGEGEEGDNMTEKSGKSGRSKKSKKEKKMKKSKSRDGKSDAGSSIWAGSEGERANAGLDAGFAPASSFEQ